MSNKKNNASHLNKITESDSGIELSGIAPSCTTSTCSLSPSQNPSHSTDYTENSFECESQSTTENTPNIDNDSKSSQTGYISKSSSFQADSSISNVPPRRLVRNIQSYLRATTVARNHVAPLSSNRIKRLATRKSKSMDSRCKFETKNVLLKNLMSQYDEAFCVITDLHSIERRTRLSKVNALKLKVLFSKYESYVTTIYSLGDNYNLDHQRLNVFKSNEFMLKESSSAKNSLGSSSELNKSLPNDEQILSKPCGSETHEVSKVPATTSTSIADATSIENEEALDSVKNANEFFTCPLCAHVLLEPITLVCGCTYCKSCLKEYATFVTNLHAMNGMRMISEESQKSGASDGMPSESNIRSITNFDSECYNCGSVHKMNIFEQFKSNTLISQLVEKLWEPNLTVKNLRNEIRSFVVFDLENSDSFKLEKYEYLFQQAYKKDESNHLILVDLFLINHFGGHIEKSNMYANQIVELKPLWIMGHFLKAINSELLENYSELKSNLTMCYKLDPSMEQIKLKLEKVEMILAQSERSMQASHAAKSSRRLGMPNQKGRHDSLIDMKHGSIDNVSLKKRLRKLKSLDIPLQDISTDRSDAIKERAGLSKMSRQTENTNAQKLPKVYSVHNLACYAESQLESLEQSTEDINCADDLTSETVANDTVNQKLFYVNPALVKISDFECSLCYILLHKPVTTPCGHSFCSSCLDRSLDHQDKCPLCKSSLDEYLAERRQFTTSFLEKLIKKLYVNEYNERKRQYTEELKQLSNFSNENEVPIFVCTLAFPFAPCPLHIYEPRYRLMLRRAIESGSKQFGMCMYVEQTPYHFTEYGCMLEIKNYQFTRDGRAIVATVGGRRFRVVKVINRDGYYVANVTWVSDKRVEDEEEKLELQILHDEVYALSKRWHGCIPALQKQKIREIYGLSEMPTPEDDIQANDNGPVWHWFLLNILPLDNDFQYRFLTKVSLKERLKQIKRIVLVLMTPVQRQIFSSASNDHDNSESDRDSSEMRDGSSRSENSASADR